MLYTKLPCKSKCRAYALCMWKQVKCTSVPHVFAFESEMLAQKWVQKLDIIGLPVQVVFFY